MARRKSSETPPGRMTLPPSGECGALQALMNDGGQVTIGSIGNVPAAAIANPAKGMLVALTLHEGESCHAGNMSEVIEFEQSVHRRTL
jgi:hypothetical protein